VRRGVARAERRSDPAQRSEGGIVLNLLQFSSRGRIRRGVALLVGAVACAAGTAATAAAEPGAKPSDANVQRPSEGELARLERSLAETATLPAILKIALAKNPDLAEARGRVRAAREAAPAVSRLPDPEFEYQLWAQPLVRPVALGEAQMHMFGLSQTFPAPGTLGAEEAAAAAQTEVTLQVQHVRERELVARVRRAYAEYQRAERESGVHKDHAALTQQALDVVRAAYQGGRGTQQDVLRAQVEMTRLHSQVVVVESERRTTRALLNVLMARAPDAPLGPPTDNELGKVELRAEPLERLAASRAETTAAKSAIRAREQELEAARASGRWPSFMVGVQYMYMPLMEEPHNYGVTLGMSLPWLNPRYGEQVRAAEARAAAERDALSSSRNAARYELHAALERLKAAQETLTIIERDLLPQAQQSFESAQAIYRGGQADSLSLFDALKSLLDIRIERERALARVQVALADVERAIGRPLPTSTEVARHD
jgi:outer membrane protein TolC